MNFIWYRNTHRFIPENNRPEDLWVFFVYIRFLVMQGFKGIFSIFSLGKQFYDQLSFMGLPCPNLGTGGHAYHGPYEHITVEGMDAAVDVTLEIIKLFSQRKD